MKYYKAERYSTPSITELEITRETESSIFLMRDGKERREAKIAEYCSWHPTRGQAKVYLIRLKEYQVDNARESLIRFESELEELTKL